MSFSSNAIILSRKVEIFARSIAGFCVKLLRRAFHFHDIIPWHFLVFFLMILKLQIYGFYGGKRQSNVY